MSKRYIASVIAASLTCLMAFTGCGVEEPTIERTDEQAQKSQEVLEKVQEMQRQSVQGAQQ